MVETVETYQNYGSVVRTETARDIHTTTYIQFLTGEENFKLAKEIGMEAAKTLAVEMVKLSVDEVERGRWIQISVKNECGFVLEKVGEYFDCGRTDNVYEKIETGQVRTIAVTNCNAEFVGVKGILKYRLVDHPDDVYMAIYFENPYYGRNYHNVRFWNDKVSQYDLYVRIPKIGSKDVATTHWADSVYGASSMTDGNNSSIGIGLTAGTVNAGGDEKSFRSYHNTYLRANPDGKVDLVLHCHSHEKWYIILRDHNKCFIRSVHGTFLRGTPSGHVDVVANCNEWEEWTLIHSSGKIGLRSFHGTFIRAKEDETVDLVGECKAWELWNI